MVQWDSMDMPVAVTDKDHSDIPKNSHKPTIIKYFCLRALIFTAGSLICVSNNDLHVSYLHLVTSIVGFMRITMRILVVKIFLPLDQML